MFCQLSPLFESRFTAFVEVFCIDARHRCFQFISSCEEDPLFGSCLTQQHSDQISDFRIFIGKQSICFRKQSFTTITQQQDHAIVFVARLRCQIEESLGLNPAQIDRFFLCDESDRPTRQVLFKDVFQISEADGE